MFINEFKVKSDFADKLSRFYQSIVLIWYVQDAHFVIWSDENADEYECQGGYQVTDEFEHSGDPVFELFLLFPWS